MLHWVLRGVKRFRKKLRKVVLRLKHNIKANYIKLNRALLMFYK